MNTITRQDLTKTYDLIKQIIDIKLKRDDIKFTTSEIAPSKYDDMIRFYNEFNMFLVYNGGDHGHLGKEYNIKFRALHDFMHMNEKLTFSFKDEKHLSDLTCVDFVKIAYNELDATHWDIYLIKEVITAEIKGQIEYYELNKEYVKDQAQFINNALNVA